MKSFVLTWQSWALMSDAFAGRRDRHPRQDQGEVNADYATFIRTIVILITVAALLMATGQWASPGSGPTRTDVFLFVAYSA